MYSSLTPTVEQLPSEIRKHLKWKTSSITPIIVRTTIARSGFRSTKDEDSPDWLGMWGRHMKAPMFKPIREYQKVNHFPGTFQIGRKDRLWRNLHKMQVQFSKKEFGFFPLTYVLPQDLRLLKRAWDDGGSRQKWIIKPPASARGIGIKVINAWKQIPKKRSVIVQKYISHPYLINESKFDLRIYVYVTDFDPMRIYVFEDGLVRFASCKYSHSSKTIGNRFVHLTNYSINKKNDQYRSNEDEQAHEGHKWSLKALWNYYRSIGVDWRKVWDDMKDLIVKTCIAVEGPVNGLIKGNVRSRYSTHELFGFDVMLDENLKPWIIEVNISPSLHSNAALDINVKGPMIADLLNIAGFQLPPEVGHEKCKSSRKAKLIVFDPRLYSYSVSQNERDKHHYYTTHCEDERAMSTILEKLTPDDVRCLVRFIDEDSRKGRFECAFPTVKTQKYLHFFETQKYYNLLLNAWCQKYHRREERGISLLERICAKGVHLQSSGSDAHHIWAPPGSNSGNRLEKG